MKTPVREAPTDRTWSPGNPTGETRPEDRVPVSEKIALGAGSLPLFYGNAGVKTLVVPAYQMLRGLNPALLGLVLALPHCWDAVTDPLVGMISDNCRTRFGRRRPIIALGAILQAVTFGTIWIAPSSFGPRATLAYLAGTLILFYTCFSVFAVPLTSLTYEMTPDYRERTRVTAFGGFFSKVAELTYGWMFWIANLAIFGTVANGLKYVGWGIAGVIMGLVGLVPALFVRERYAGVARRQEAVRFGPAVRAVIANRAFAVIAGLLICQVIGGMLASNLDYYLLVYPMSGGNVAEGTKWKAILTSGYAIIGMLSIYPVNWLANRAGKRAALAMIFLLVLAGAAGKWLFFTPGHPWKILLDPLLCAPIYPALIILIPSMIADACDDDELRHGLRREGMVAAFFSWIQKAGYAASFFGSGLALYLTGFDAALGGAQPARAILAMRVILAGATAVWAVVALGLLRFYPLNRQRAGEIRAQLEARRGRVR
ncbi:MAG TPA: MFS transporter [Opitutaceae bacterium]|nr:MFS transporter [Opitutaceae bacterium]